MEKFIYEIRPYFFLFLSAFSIVTGGQSGLRFICGILLLTATAVVLRNRYLNRLHYRNF